MPLVYVHFSALIIGKLGMPILLSMGGPSNAPSFRLDTNDYIT